MQQLKAKLLSTGDQSGSQLPFFNRISFSMRWNRRNHSQISTQAELRVKWRKLSRLQGELYYSMEFLT